MSVYNDMASDAGYSYGSEENTRLGYLLEEQHRINCQEDFYAQEEETSRREILFRKYD